MIRRLSPAVVVLALLLGWTVVQAGPAVVAPSAAALLADVEKLTVAEMDGRGSGTTGNEIAARYLAGALAAAGLRPGGDQGTFFQSFALTRGTRLAPGSALAVSTPAARNFEIGREWTPHGGSVRSEVSAGVVFAGYGLTAPEAGHDDYAGLDVQGKIVVVLDGAPPHLPQERRGRLEKLISARRRGAAAVLIAADSLPTLAATSTSVGLVSATISPAVADAFLAPHGTTTRLATRIADTRRPASFVTGTRGRVRVELTSEAQRTANVIGVLPGTDPALAGEAVVIGAHFDHLGRVGGVTHPGADDNASGTAVALGLARAFATGGGLPRTLVFAFFSGEEIALLGSSHYVAHAAIPIARTVAMLNFDMVGRMRDDKLYVGGADSGSTLRQAVVEAAQEQPVDLIVRGTPYSASDHVRFYGAGAPVLFFFTGLHDDYHRPTDTADRIDAPGMACVASIATGVIERLADRPRPVYVRLDPPARRSGGTPGTALFGIVAARDGGADGLRLAGVQPGSAAARAGVREGDVIVRFAGTPVNSFEELRRAVAARRPGDRVDVVYLRNGEDHAGVATLDANP